MLELAYPGRPWKDFFNAAGFLAPDYLINGVLHHHKGIDLNLKGAADIDLGYPVQAMFPGTVVAAASYNGWGNIVLLRADEWIRDYVAKVLGEKLEVLDAAYCHLKQMSVAEGDNVSAGDHVGSIGKGWQDEYPAHLHFELRKVARPANDPQGIDDATKQRIETQYLDPEAVLRKLTFSDFGNILPERRLVTEVRAVGIEGGVYAVPKTVIANVVDRKFFVRTQDPEPPGGDSPGGGDAS